MWAFGSELADWGGGDQRGGGGGAGEVSPKLLWERRGLGSGCVSLQMET